jgi:hypothetical protein
MLACFVSNAQSPTQTPTSGKAEGDRDAGTTAAPLELSPQPMPGPFRFTDVVKDSGVDFVHFSGTTPDKHFPTANGSGVALFDYDGDGRLDLYFATATNLPLGTGPKNRNRLYKNLGGWRFRDVTESAGVGFAGFCHSALAGDIDNDGDQDLFLFNCGPNVLFRNNGDGTFTDISASAGISRPGWSTGGAFLDFDNDGDLDLYVANYGDWTLPRDDIFCGRKAPTPIRVYCSPRFIRPAKHFLYRNNGDGTFTDVYDTAISSVDPQTGKPAPRSDGRGFAAVAADLNADGRVDLHVANDLSPNFLFLNRGDGTFEDATEASGAAFDTRGQPQSSMGVDAEDIDGDGLPELYVTNYSNEYNTLYQNLSNGTFLDMTAFFGLAGDTFPFVGWGTALADFDSDGWPDNFVANGHVDDNRVQLGQNYEYAQPALLFANQAGKRFRLATRGAGAYFEGKHSGRGAAFGDIDNDGDIDIVVSHKDGPPALLRNDSPRRGGWIRLDLRGTRSNRDAVGARIEVDLDGRVIHRQRKGGGSVEASNDPRVLVGLGPDPHIKKLTIRWPSGAVGILDKLEPDAAYRVTEPAKLERVTDPQP